MHRSWLQSERAQSEHDRRYLACLARHGPSVSGAPNGSPRVATDGLSRALVEETLPGDGEVQDEEFPFDARTDRSAIVDALRCRGRPDPSRTGSKPFEVDFEAPGLERCMIDLAKVEAETGGRMRLKLGVLALMCLAVGMFTAGTEAASRETFRCQGQAATMVGKPGPDRIVGTSRADVIVARGGADIINGGGGDDLICAGSGDDTVNGGGGSDRIYGEANDDQLTGGPGVDILNGGFGSDLCSLGDEHSACEREPGVAPFRIREGVYSTSYGKMRFDQTGTSVTAAYTVEDGRIPDGVLDFRTRKLVGHWIEPSSARNCGALRNGTAYWGRLEFTFSEDGTSYSGVWGYCDEKPTRGWTATWESR